MSRHFNRDAVFSRLARERGLTLIEVMIALAIVGIAMLAVLKAVTQNIRATQHIQQKTMALWVGQTVLNEARVGIKGKEAAREQLGQAWYTHLETEDTPNPHIKRIRVTVYASMLDKENEHPLLTLESYQYKQGAS